MIAIFKKDFLQYFRTSVGYIFLAVFYLFTGVFLYFGSLSGATKYADISGLFMSCFQLILSLLPLLTMRLFSEEKKNRSDQSLLTAPVTAFSIVMGKFLSAFLLYIIAGAILLVYAFVFSFFAVLDWGVIFSCVSGFLLLGAALIAIGMFISTLSENQIVSGIITFIVFFFFSISDELAGLVNISVIKNVLLSVSFLEHYYRFILGVLTLTGITYFISLTALFFVLTVFSLKRDYYKN